MDSEIFEAPGAQRFRQSETPSTHWVPTRGSRQPGSNKKAKRAKAFARFMTSSLQTNGSVDLPLWEASSRCCSPVLPQFLSRRRRNRWTSAVKGRLPTWWQGSNVLLRGCDVCRVARWASATSGAARAAWLLAFPACHASDGAYWARHPHPCRSRVPASGSAR